jgi:hypothetical protein
MVNDNRYIAYTVLKNISILREIQCSAFQMLLVYEHLLRYEPN